VDLEAWAGAAQMDGSPGNVSGVSRQGALLIAFFLFGIARSWQLVGARDFSLASTVAAVTTGQPAKARGRRRAQAAMASPAADQDDP
jgi:hypothetical protein